ncbi:sorting nexin-14 isoform X2 [Diabrotica virgifera virgifera]|uniref:Sorting nexin-14-like isoform X2 n=1 Tax=Diabrotica virgifera virgifera TaxID=50390 RepID=A0A6P7G407_DIAVI|nr:sorting nexin-14 isoform X2 [Diabrotica virgifera virgifera]
MVYEEIKYNLRLVSDDKLVRTVTIGITLSVLLFGIFFRPLGALVIYVSYLFGFTVAWFLVKYKTKTTIYLQRLINFYRGHISVKKTLKPSCSICDDLSCRRHQQTRSITPWKHIYITAELNNRIEHFYERIISTFISSWYDHFTDDKDFVNELRYCFRFSTATVVNRLLELDIGDIVANKLVPCGVRHIDDYLYIQQIAKLKNVRFNEVVIEYLGKRLHAAATNRKNELGYLRHLVSSLLNHVLPGNYLKCRNFSVMMREVLAGWVLLPMMDVIADPNILNYLVILAATYKSKKTTKSNQNTEEVEFLCNYISTESKVSSFSTSLNKIKKNTELLYAFMQFLKNNDNVNLLQFCLAVDDFNVKLLTPELSKKQVEELHVEAKKLYKEYLDKNSFSFISCPSEISEDFKFLMQDDYAVEKLSKLSKLLYTAYDFVFNVLESVWLPQFFHSNEFYGYICGPKAMTGFNKQGQNKLKKYYEPTTGQGAVSKISSSLGKIKGVLKTNQPIEGAFFPLESQSVENGTTDEIFLHECKSLFRDMSTWKISIPTFQTSPTNKVIYFYVSVERMDVHVGDTKKNWIVLRKDQDFYTLKAKLVEFHGESEICDSPLPSRKAGSSIETRLVKYEEFIRKLLKKSNLKGSDLLYYFLTTEQDFATYLAANASNIQDIGNIYQSVAYKLRKEKGQHLDPFMNSFLMSTGVTKTDKFEWAEIGEETDSLISKHMGSFPKTYRNQVFNDNFGVPYNILKDTMSNSLSPDGITESAFYLMKNIFKIPNGLLRLYASICSIAQQFVDLCARTIIEKKIKSSLNQSNLAYLIKQLEDVIFDEHTPVSKEELSRRKVRAVEELENSISNILTQILGPGIKDGAKLLLEIVQNPHFNKQLAYNLLDIVLTEMYPMLDKNEEHY